MPLRTRAVIFQLLIKHHIKSSPQPTNVIKEQLPNYMLHPRVATITYLSDTGVPTLVMDKCSPPPSDPEKKSLDGSIHKAWLSHPRFGKHVAFDGRFLHGGPGRYFPSVAKQSEDSSPPKT